MTKGKIKKVIKREVVRAVLERTQGIDMEKLGAPKAENAVHFDNVEEILNIPYMNRDEVPLGMDIFRPIVPEGTEMPVIVTIHGGGLTMGDRKISRPFGRILANKGYLVFSIEYRLAPRANVCMELDDICAGLDLVGQKLVDYDVDFDRIFMAAESAGAYLAAYVTAMKGSKKLQEAIGYEPTRVSFKAIGLLSGMLYTNRKDPGGWMLADQIYGEKRADENFLQYMNPEHPEIINNLPPCFLVTSKADFLNNYSFLMDEALKKAGKPCKLLYYGDDDLMHAFTTLQTDHPKAIDSIDRMLAWFEEQAKLQASAKRRKKTLSAKREKMTEAMNDGSLDNQKVWQYIKERASVEPERLYQPAILDCSRTYTYAQMFEEWDKYARVFSALGITDKNKSRVAIVGSISAEPLFSFYAANMTGAAVSMFSYPDLLPGGRWKTMVEKEHITDMVISDIMVTPQMWYEIRKAKEEFGLKNVILLHSRMGGPCIGPAEMVFNEFNYNALKRIPDVQFMDDLVYQYRNEEIRYGKKTGDGIAVICHTSGTTNGTRKPLPFTDRKLNRLCSDSPTGVPKSVFTGMEEMIKAGCFDPTEFAGFGESSSSDLGRIVIIPPFDFSAASNINGFVNMSFASGNTIVLTFFGFLHPKFVRAFKYYNVFLAFSSGFMLDQWMTLPDIEKDAFSSLRILGFGGSYISPAKMEKYEAFLKEHGFKGICFQGYGMSETSGNLFLRPKYSDEDTIGFPDDIDNIRLFDEESGSFHTIKEGVMDGVLYSRSDTMCLNMLDGEKLFDLTEIDGKDYICTYDVVHVDDKGSLSYVGRANQFFTNNEGVKFESGLVEKQLSGQPNINLCGIVPVLDKRIHDTVPLLYVVPEHKENAAEEISKAILDVYTKDEKLKDSVLPSQFVVVDKIPVGATGKIDVYNITRNRTVGTAYNIIPVKTDGVLTDVKYEKAEQINSHTAGTLPEGMGKDSAFGVFDLFTGTPKTLNLKKVPEKVKEKKDELGEMFEKVKPFLPKVDVTMPEFKMDGMMGMPKMPPLLTAITNIAMALVADVQNRTDDFEE